jgi:hypothetical protein
MSATASTGSPTLRRSIASRSVSQENTGASDDMTARLVSFNFESPPIHFIIFTSALSTPTSQGKPCSLSFLPQLTLFHKLPHKHPPLQFPTSTRQIRRYIAVLSMYSVTNSAMKDLKKSATALGSNKLGNQVAPKVSRRLILHRVPVL